MVSATEKLVAECQARKYSLCNTKCEVMRFGPLIIVPLLFIMSLVCMANVDARFHRVKRGETLWGIVRQEGVDFDELLEQNGIKIGEAGWELIKPDDRLIVRGGRKRSQEEGVTFNILSNGVTSLYYHEFGMPGELDETLKIDVVRCHLEYQRDKNCRFNHDCTEDEWSYVISNLNAIAVESWKKRYDNRDIIDGTSWHLTLYRGTAVVREYGGANAGPDTLRRVKAIKNFVLEHPAFIAAFPKIAEEDRRSKEYVKRVKAWMEGKIDYSEVQTPGGKAKEN